MASVKTILFVIIFVLFLVKSSGSNDCPANQEISCDSLRSSKGFTYTVPSNITCFRSCNEQGWYFQNGTFIVDSTPNAGGKKLQIVVDVTPQNLTVSACEKLQWQLNCGTCMCTINFTDMKHSPAHDPRDEQDGNNNDNAGFSPWGIVLIGSFSAGAFITLLFCSVRKIKRANCCSDSKQDDVI